MNIERSRLLCSIQRGLLGHVTPNLRAVCLNYVGHTIKIVFYYDNVISEQEGELVESVLDDVISDFPRIINGIELDYEVEKIRIDYPKKMPLIGDWVYYRYEPSN